MHGKRPQVPFVQTEGFKLAAQEDLAKQERLR